MANLTYTLQEVETASCEYFAGDSLAANVFASKYALRELSGLYRELTPEHLHRRAAREFARIEAKFPSPMSESEIFELFDRFKYVVPQGSPMAAIGNLDFLQTASNCFVVESPYDSYGGILWADQELTQIMKRRGGVGVDISTLRPKNLLVRNAAITTDGIEVFMERYSNTTREVAQNGRRGALMITLDVHHPQIRDFINIKRDSSKVTGANISVRLSDEFLQAVDRGTKVQLRFPCQGPGPFLVEQWVDARELWQEIINAAHACADPGLLLWGNIHRYGPADAYPKFRSISTNPCAEIPLNAYDSCRLMVLNTTSFVLNPFTEEARFDFDHFREVSGKAQRLMDDLIEIELEQIQRILEKIQRDPEPEEIKQIELILWNKIKDAAEQGRRTGLGPTGIGDTVAMLGLRYGSDESIAFVEELYKTMAVGSYTSSILMAEQRGAFPAFSLEIEAEHPFIQRIIRELPEEIQAKYRQFGRRNIANTTTAPVGSTSLMTQTTSGIEPVYLLEYKRRRKVASDSAQVDFVDDMGDKWQEYVVSHHGLQRWREVTGGKDAEKSPYANATAEKIDWQQRVKLQAAAQRWVCHAISSTVNLPRDVSVDVVKDIYMAAWKAGCKGITVYRDGAKNNVLESLEAKSLWPKMGPAPERPEELECDIKPVKIKVKDGSDLPTDWVFFVGLLEGRPYEVFGGTSENIEIPAKLTKGRLIRRKLKTGSKYDLVYGEAEDPHKIKDLVRVFDNPTYGAVTRLISLSLRHSAPVYAMVEQLQRDKDSNFLDFTRVLGRVLKSYIPDGTQPQFDRTCPDCKAENALLYQEGCLLCTSCGSSKCA